MTTSTTPGPRAGRHALGASTPSPAGWYLDPSVGLTRWWDGQAWTGHIALPPVGTADHQLTGTSHRHASATVLPEVRGRHRSDRGPGRTVSAGWVAMGIVAALAAVGAFSALHSDPQVGARPPTAPSSVLLVSETGSGDRILPGFTAAGPVQVQYNVDCGNLGRRGGFQIVTSPPGEQRVLVNDSGDSFGKVVVLSTTPGAHVLQVRSPCGWVVTISQRPPA